MKKILQVGPGVHSRGGINTVISRIMQFKIDGFVFDRVATFEGGRWFEKIYACLLGLLIFLFKVFKCEIVHIHCSLGNSIIRKLPFFLIAFVLRKKIVLHLHTPDFENLKLNFISREMIKKASAVIVLSESWLKIFFNQIQRDYVVIHNPADPLLKVDNSEDTILFAGKLEDRKGYRELIQSLANVDLKGFRLKLAGNGEVENAKKLAQKHGVTTAIDILGWQSEDEMRELYSKSKIFVLPSYAEGLPMSLIDAMSAGCIPVISYVGGISDVCSKENSIEISYGNSLNIADGISKAIYYSKLGSKMSKNAVSTAEKEFSAVSIASKLKHLYSDLKK